MKHEYTIRLCRRCDRKRWIFDLGVATTPKGSFRKYRCSQGHRWRRKMSFCEVAAETLKAIYAPLMTELLKPSPLMKMMERPIDATSRSFTIPLHVGRNV